MNAATLTHSSAKGPTTEVPAVDLALLTTLNCRYVLAQPRADELIDTRASLVVTRDKEALDH
jgi:hypothetical protein